MSEKQILVLSVPPELEDALVDWMLEDETHAGFTSSVTHGHSRDTSRYNLTEQVTGKQRRIQFQIVGLIEEIDTLIQGLAAGFRDTGIHYWVVPVLKEARL